MRRALVAVVLLGALARTADAARPTSTVGGPAAVQLPGTRGPTCATCGTGTTTPAAVVVPVGQAGDLNCPSTLPSHSVENIVTANYIEVSQLCATGANAAGYDVVSVSMFIGGTAAPSDRMKCSVYNGATPHAKVAAGCDSVEWIGVTNPNAFITLATTGACHLAAATRYWAGCNTPQGIGYGMETTAGNIMHYQTTPYASDPLPASWTSAGDLPRGMALYVTATPTP